MHRNEYECVHIYIKSRKTVVFLYLLFFFYYYYFFYIIFFFFWGGGRGRDDEAPEISHSEQSLINVNHGDISVQMPRH